MNYKKITIEHDNSKIIDKDIFKNLKISLIENVNNLTIEYDPKLVTHQNLLQKLASLKINIKDIKIEDNDFEELFIKLINK